MSTIAICVLAGAGGPSADVHAEQARSAEAATSSPGRSTHSRNKLRDKRLGDKTLASRNDGGEGTQNPKAQNYKYADDVPETATTAEDESENYPESARAPVDPRPKLPPQGHTQRFAYRLDRPLTYLARGSSRVNIKEREDLRQVYATNMRLHYERLDSKEARNALPAAWSKALNSSELTSKADRRLAHQSDAEYPGMTVMVTVESFNNGFEIPQGLQDPTHTHQLLRQARFSYWMEPTGRIEDIQFHAPTQLLSRSSLSAAAQQMEGMAPVFPKRAIKPGDTWVQKVPYRDSEGTLKMSQDTENHYTFEKWTHCRAQVCGMIRIEQKLRVSGRLQRREGQTEAASSGQGEGWILFDPQRGEVVKSYWKLLGQGFVRSKQRAEVEPAKLGPRPAELKTEASAEVLVEVEMTVERVDPLPSLRDALLPPSGP